MGWWSCTIMGGDTPLDAQGDMQDAVGLRTEELYPDSNDERVSDEYIHEQIKANVPAMIDVALSNSDNSWYPGVYKQVLGVMVMSAGCDPADEDVKLALKIAKEGAEDDDWDDDERREYIAAFIKQLDEYDGTPQDPKSEGLFEKVMEAVDEGNTGLVNKQYT